MFANHAGVSSNLEIVQIHHEGSEMCAAYFDFLGCIMPKVFDCGFLTSCYSCNYCMGMQYGE